ncbi:DUF192 domain-containing protein [Marinicauda algicola]|uniref:DUF192 domain-containing protein n=1 Tax=Marinicauda algicola TaxID=2029849 RepID=A0A4S2GYE3_9PROT|nr:DUF192 domain-containing protein [Marinicauda algicola]TGY87958.1 DUF192 domain-containing protein [Marinicauda algicola]
MIRFIALSLALVLTAGPVAAQIGDGAPPADPAARDAVVEYGGPETVVIETDEGPVSFTVEIAATEPARQRGLMWREELAPDAGMLFDFATVRPVSIWMRNTLIPLDIIYIRQDGTIAKIIAHAQPLSERQLLSGVPVRSVLEINAGRAAELGIEPGDLVRHAWFGTAQAPAGPDAADAGTDGEAQPQEG